MARFTQMYLLSIPASADSSIDQWTRLGYIPAADAGTVVYHSVRFSQAVGYDENGQQRLEGTTTVAFSFTENDGGYNYDQQGNLVSAARGMEVQLMATRQPPQTGWIPAFINHYHSHMVYLKFIDVTSRLFVYPDGSWSLTRP